MTRPTVHYCRQLGIWIILYLNDSLILVRSYQIEHRDIVLCLLQSLGLKINLDRASWPQNRGGPWWCLFLEETRSRNFTVRSALVLLLKVPSMVKGLRSWCWWPGSNHHLPLPSYQNKGYWRESTPSLPPYLLVTSLRYMSSRGMTTTMVCCHLIKIKCMIIWKRQTQHLLEASQEGEELIGELSGGEAVDRDVITLSSEYSNSEAHV